MNKLAAVNQFQDFILATNVEDLPPEACESARTFLMDSIAVGISGSRLGSSKAVLLAAKQWGEGNSATVLGNGARLPATSAAYVNAFQVHCQEFDCLHEGATVHAMAVLTGALLAMAEDRGYSGNDLILATTIGVEVAVALGLAATRGLKFFRPATAGLMGATAALARLEGFDGQKFLDAWGLAYSQLAGTMQAHVEGSVALPLQVAGAARAAVTSIQLAKQGLSGPHDILEGPFGYFKLYEPKPELEPVLDCLGKPWRVTELSHKPYPTGRAAQATLEALAQVRDELDLRSQSINSVYAYVPPLVKRLVDRPVQPGMKLNYARLCLPYLSAVMIRDGQVDTDSFDQESLGDQQLHELGSRVQIIEDGNPDPNALRPQRIEVELTDGMLLTRDISHTLGSPANPLNPAQRKAKFLHCTQSAGMHTEQSLHLQAGLETLAEATTIAAIMEDCTA